MRLVPAYTLETLDNCDINRLLPYYFFDYRLNLRAKLKTEQDQKEENTDENIVIRNGKKYRVVRADQTSWADKMF